MTPPVATHQQAIQQQFDPQAQAYLASTVHAQGPDLAHAPQWVARHLPATKAHVLDVGCGAGHLTFALAPHVHRIMAADPSPGMLDTVRQAAAHKGLGNIDTVQAQADALPFEDGHFCAVATRYSAHHWTALEASLREMHRVTKPGGHLLVIDILGHEDALVDTHLQAMEVLRDRSHVRNRSATQWAALLRDAGFTVHDQTQWPVRLAFADWVARMRTPALQTDAIRRLQQGAPQEVQQALAIEPDGSFTPRAGLFWAQKGQ
jgi:ubiquinone/menaquinone biosynthesis C-methylase UbiE